MQDNKLNLKIDTEKCIKCGKCINDCISHVLDFDDNGLPCVVRPKNCIKCQHCFAICPTGALSVFNKNPNDSEAIKETYNSDEILNLIQNRRSIRKYKQENLDKETLDKLKNMLKWVPTGVNFKGLHFSFVDNIETMNEIRNYTNKKTIKILSNPLSDILFSKFKNYKKAILDGEDLIFRSAPHMIIVSADTKSPCKDIDPTIALSYFELYARSLGVGTCWCGIAYKVFSFFPELLKRFEIPKDYKLSYVMLFGKPAVEYKRAIQPDEFKIISVK